MGIVIRKPTLEEIDSLMPLWEGQIQYHNNLDSEYYTGNTEETERECREHTKKMIETGEPHILVAYDNDMPVGFVTFKIEHEDYLDTKIKEYIEVTELYVDEKSRGKKIGTELLSKVEEFAKQNNIAYVHLECTTGNHSAMDFYKNYGFQNKHISLFKKVK